MAWHRLDPLPCLWNCSYCWMCCDCLSLDMGASSTLSFDGKWTLISTTTTTANNSFKHHSQIHCKLHQRAQRLHLISKHHIQISTIQNRSAPRRCTITYLVQSISGLEKTRFFF